MEFRLAETFIAALSRLTRDEQKQLVTRALRAKCWFKIEGPLWAQPLPLTAESCYALFNGPYRGNHRASLVGRYGQLARSMHWSIERMPPFEVFCAGVMAPPP